MIFQPGQRAHSHGRQLSKYKSKSYLRIKPMLKISDCPYADQIRSAMTAYLPMWDWLWGASQLYQESAWKATAHNAGSGAMGLGQFLPSTWLDMVERLAFPVDASAYDPTYAIPAYAFYMKTLRLEWSHVPRSEDERRKLAQASYNAGWGRVLDAQKWLVANGGAYNNALSIIAAMQHTAPKAVADQAADYVLKCAKWFGDLSTSEIK